MKTSNQGVALIKRFEGCMLKAYKAVDSEEYWTIGYGHYGPDVHQGDIITKERAEELLRGDLDRFEQAVEKAGTWSQSEFDALVSFTYNCGARNLQKLIKDRTHAQIADAMLLYVKAGGYTLQGLVRRRKAERELFLAEPAPVIVTPKPKVDKSVDSVDKKKKAGGTAAPRKRKTANTQLRSDTPK